MNKLKQPLAGPNADIAIIGMAGRFPGAENIEKFWENLRDGVESITFFSDQELKASGVDPVWLDNPNYVKAGGILQDIDLFDADFFNFNGREAEMLDPQHRLLLECTYETLENAGYPPDTYPGLIGIYAGSRFSEYLLYKYKPIPDMAGLNPGSPVTNLQAIFSNYQDYLTTRISYKLNLRGPSFTVQTACSTSLVAVHLACQSLIVRECDIALAGGIVVKVPHKAGYTYSEGLIFSPDGHTRAFDARAAGTLFSSGVAMVALKRLEEALADGDCIHAVIKGSAINNDGSELKAAYAAPSENGQAAAIARAFSNARLEPESITYIEAHGTGTAIGDPTEVASMSKIFRTQTEKKGFCAIGSLKSNVGHLGQAAGVAGLIKVTLMLKHKLIPPSLNYDEPNPRIDFDNSPFFLSILHCQIGNLTGHPVVPV